VWYTLAQNCLHTSTLSMSRILARDLPSAINQTVTVRGWYSTLRELGRVNFLVLRDRTGLMQIVIEDKQELKKLSGLHSGTVLCVEALVAPSTQTELGVELVKPRLTIESAVRDVPPLEYYKHEMPSDLETILDYRSVSLRNRKLQAVFRIQAEIAHAYRLYMHDVVQASEYFGPNMIGASSEGGAEFFKVDYFNFPATLAQSSQLYKQVMVGVNERVFALMPFFRAEKSNTVRHLTEGKQLEFEMGFFESWHEVLDIEEGCIKFIVKYLKERCASDLAALENPLITVPEDVPFPRITFAEAQEIYFTRTGVDDRQEDDLSPAAERELCAYALEEFGTECVFVLDWKTSKRPFYSFPKEDNPELTNTFDLLCAGSEITSGGQRRHTYDSMVEGIRLKGLDPADFTDYLNIFRFGMPPHGGFGLGLERLTMTLLRLKNVREASLFPSDPKRIAGNRLKAKIFTGAENVRNEIIRLLRENECDFQHVKHEATPTSEDSARVRGTTLAEGVKAIVVRGKTTKKNFQINVPSHMKLDMKAVAEAVGEKCEFEDVKAIEERFGLQVGGIPPFGPLLGIETFFDQRIPDNTRAAFNCGMQTESIVMQSADLVRLVEPKIGNFAKE
jgi:nondiscriminating aspartyl-tRNA synthetase